MTLIDLFMGIFFGGLAVVFTCVCIINMINIGPPKKVEEVEPDIEWVFENPKATKRPTLKKKKPKVNTQIKPVKPKPATNTTTKETKDMVISGLVHIGMKKVDARSLVLKMCKNKYYDDAQKLFEDCFPHIK